MKTIILISSHWNFSNGGINSFNFDLGLHLGLESQKCGIRTICLCYIDPNLSHVNVAKEHFLEIVSLNKSKIEIEFQNDIQIIQNKLEELKIDGFIYFVGHDIFTGDLANFLKNQYPDRSTSIVFHHMDYESYYAIKGNLSPRELAAKFSKQTSILQSADLVIGVGPKLYNSALNKTSKIVNQLIPGIQKIEKWNRKSDKLNAITFGRYDERTDRLKQMGLAVSSFNTFINTSSTKFSNDATLKIVGINTSEEATKLISHASESKRYLNILPLPYTEDRKSLFDTLRKSNICLMLSYHEGFGLAGYESIAANVPLILSKNSGLYEFILSITKSDDLVNYGIYSVQIESTMDGTINPKDQDLVVKAIEEVYSDIDNYTKNIEKLKEILLFEYSWAHSAKSFIDLISLIDTNLKRQSHSILSPKSKIEKAPDYVKLITGKLAEKAVSLPPNQVHYVHRKILENEVESIIDTEGTVFLVGDHGTGKSSIAKNYIAQNYSNFDHIIWVDFQINIQQSLLRSILSEQEFSSRIFQESLEGLYRTIIHSMNESKGQKLFVVDNFDDLDELNLFIKKFNIYGWNVLITTTKNLTLIPESQKVIVETMSYPEGHLLYKDIVGNCSDNIELDEFEKTFRQEELTPFLIEIFSYSIKQDFLSNSKSVIKIPSNEEVKTPYRFFNPKRSLENFLHELFERESRSFSERQTLFLYVYALLPNNYSDHEITRNILLLNFINEEIIEYFNLFVEFGWISNSKQVHYLRQRIILEFINPPDEPILKILNYLSDCLEVSSGINPLSKLRYMPIAYSLKEKLPDHPIVNLIIHKLGILEFDLGNLKKALSLQDSLLPKIQDEKLLGDILFDIGLIKERIGQYQNSVFYLKEALNYRAKLSLEKLNTLSKISVVYGKLYSESQSKDHEQMVIGYYKKVELLLEKILNIGLKEKDDPDIATIYIDSASVLGKLEDYQDIANQLFVKGINIYEAKLSKVHPWLATTYNLYGNFLLSHDIKLGLRFILDSLKIREEIYSDNKNHYSLAESYHDLASALFQSGEYLKALENVEQAISIRKHIFGSEKDMTHPRLQSSINLKNEISLKMNISS